MWCKAFISVSSSIQNLHIAFVLTFFFFSLIDPDRQQLLIFCIQLIYLLGKNNINIQHTILISKAAVLDFSASGKPSNFTIIGPSHNKIKVLAGCVSATKKTKNIHPLNKSKRYENPSNSPSSSLLLRDFGWFLSCNFF